MLAKKGFRLTLLIIAIIGVVIGIVYALDFLGIINFSNTASKVPVVGKYFTNAKSQNNKEVVKSDLTKSNTNQVQSLMEANQKLASSNSDMNKRIAELNDKISKLIAEKADLDKKFNDELSKSQLPNVQNRNNLEEEKYRKLAKYYSSMKPDAAVKIMNELEDYLVIEILNRVDSDQTAKILSKMDPKKAANISKQMTN